MAVQHRLPAIYFDRLYATKGGLMSYGADDVELFRRGGPSYVDRILRGAKPSELPVQFPTKFELVINLKTATPHDPRIIPATCRRGDRITVPLLRCGRPVLARTRCSRQRCKMPAMEA
jgi:putative ABC transport system substrate-binding protein